MRKTMFFLAVFGLPTSLWAADPITGTWKPNIAKSSFGPGVKASRKEQTNIVRELTADQVEVSVTGIGMVLGQKTINVRYTRAVSRDGPFEE